MTLTNTITTLLVFVAGTLNSYADPLPDSTRAVSPMVVSNTAKEAAVQHLLQQFRIPVEQNHTDPIIPDLAVTDSVQYHRDKAQDYAEEVQRRNAFIVDIGEMVNMELPVWVFGISRGWAIRLLSLSKPFL